MQRNGLIDLLVDLPPTMNVVRRFIAVSRSLLISCHPSRLRFGDAGDLIFPRATTNHRGSTLPPVIPTGVAVSAGEWRALLFLRAAPMRVPFPTVVTPRGSASETRGI